MEPNKLAVQRLFDQCFNDGRLDAVDALATPESAAALRKSASALRTGFPDIRYVLDDVVGEGDRVAVRWTWTGTHTGTFAGPQATYAPTQQRVTNTGMAVFRFEGGRIVSSSLETDRLGFLLQLGVVSKEQLSQRR